MYAIQTTNLTKYYGKSRGIVDLNLAVKKGEFLIGRQLSANDPLLLDPEATQQFILETFMQLVPLYRQAYTVYEIKEGSV